MAPKRVYLGVDLGGTKILAAVVDGAGVVLARAKTKTLADEGVKAVVERVAACAAEAVDSAGVKRVAALGVGVAGPVDVKRGVVLTAGNMPWRKVPLARLLRERLEVDAVCLDNDVNAGTYGEWKHGAGRGCDNLLGMFVGTGIGGGLVLNGALYRGHYHTAGEIGHTIINAGGDLTHRSLEDLASRSAMGIALGRRVATNHSSLLAELIPPNKLFTRLRSGVLAEAYNRGDDEVVRCVHQAARHAGTAAANAVTLLSLPRVVVGGGVTEAIGEAFVQRVAAQLAEDIYPPTLKVDVAEAALGDDAAVVGAALLARDAAT